METPFSSGRISSNLSAYFYPSRHAQTHQKLKLMYAGRDVECKPKKGAHAVKDD